MADPLSIGSAVVGLVVPALHGLRLLSTDLERIKNAPAAVARLKDDVAALSDSLTLVKAIDDATWSSLGAAVQERSSAALQSCADACDNIRGDLQRWTKRSQGVLTWRDRVSVGFFKQKQVEALASQLQAYRLTFNSVVGIATLYSSLHNGKATEELRTAIITQRASLESARQSVSTEIATVDRGLSEIQRASTPDTGADDEDEAREGAADALADVRNVLRLVQALLGELAARSQEKELQTAGNDRVTTVTFGSNNHGMQIGTSTGSVVWNAAP